MLPIHKAASEGDLEAVRRELDAGADVNVRSHDTDQTPLHLAIQSQAAGVDLVELLIARGADINAVENRAALEYSELPQPPVLDWSDLTEESLAEYTRATEEYQALSEACSRGKRNVLALAIDVGGLDKVEALLRASADTGYKRPDGYDALIDAMHSTFGREQNQLLPLVELLLAHGAPTADSA